MAFRGQANIDPNSHKGLIISNSITNGLLVATGLSLTNAQPLHVAIVDGAGSQITSFGGGTQYAEGATTSPGTGTLSIARYNATPPSLTDKEMTALQLDSAGNLKVTGSISVGGTTDNSAFTAGSSTGSTGLGFYHSVIDTVTDGRAAAIAITSKRGQHVNLRDASGNELGISSAPLQVSLANTAANATAVKVDGSAVTQPVSGTFWQATQPVSAASLPLPSGASTSANQSTLITNTTNIPNVIGTAASAIPSKLLQIGGSDGTNARAIKTNTSGQLDIRPLTSSDQITIANSSIAVTGTFWQATQPVSGTVTANAGTGTFNTSAAQSGTWTLQPGNTQNTTPWLTAPSAQSAAVGTAIYNNTALSSTKAAVNASAGNLYGYHIYNPNSSVVYIQLFNLASASVTVGTTTPTAVLAVPAAGWADAPPSGPPIAFSTALTIAATTTSTGSGAPTTALLCNMWYK